MVQELSKKKSWQPGWGSEVHSTASEEEGLKLVENIAFTFFTGEDETGSITWGRRHEKLMDGYKARIRKHVNKSLTLFKTKFLAERQRRKAAGEVLGHEAFEEGPVVASCWSGVGLLDLAALFSGCCVKLLVEFDPKNLWILRSRYAPADAGREVEED